jgi:hypothetical protein
MKTGVYPPICVMLVTLTAVKFHWMKGEMVCDWTTNTVQLFRSFVVIFRCLL